MVSIQTASSITELRNGRIQIYSIYMYIYIYTFKLAFISRLPSISNNRLINRSVLTARKETVQEKKFLITRDFKFVISLPIFPLS